MVGPVGSYFDVGSVSEVILEPRGADDKICSMGAPSVRESESVAIEIDSGAEVSCFLVNIGADTYPLHETRLSMCDELGARIFELEAATVPGVVGAIQGHEHWQSASVDTRSEPLWLETVFLADCGCILCQERFGHS